MTLETEKHLPCFDTRYRKNHIPNLFFHNEEVTSLDLLNTFGFLIINQAENYYNNIILVVPHDLVTRCSIVNI